MSLTWTSNNGDTIPFDGSTGVVTVGTAEGIFNLPVDMVLDPRVGADGAALISERRAQRRIMLGLGILGDDTDTALTVWRTLVRALAAGGSLTYDNGTDDPRTLRNVRLESPDRSMTGQDLAFRYDDVIPVSLIALDPWWYGEEESLSGTFDAPTAWDAAIPWDSAIPWNGGAAVAIDNTGDAATPCTVVLTGATTQASMSIDGIGGWETDVALTTGAYLSVSSVPGEKGPHLGPHGYYAGADDPVDWALLTEWSDPFELPAGEFSLVVGASGTDGSTAWEIHWSPRYLTP